MKIKTFFAAKRIKKILKTKYPTTKFEIDIHFGVEYSEILITWENDALKLDVYRNLCQLQMGGINPRTGEYEYDNIDKKLPQVHFITCIRKQTKYLPEFELCGVPF